MAGTLKANFSAAKLVLVAAVGALALTGATSAEARACKRLNKTEGAAIGAVGGAVLGNVLLGGAGGAIAGAVGGGVAGHEIARTKYNKHCGRYYRRSRR
jgi:osmotically inducible lipoprotein OsmB